MSVPAAIQSPTIQDLMRQAMEETDNDLRKAVQACRARLEGDPALYRALLVPLVESALDDCGRQLLHGVRRAHFGQDKGRGPEREMDHQPRGLALLATDNLMGYPLRGGKPLGSATQAELMTEAEYYRSSGRTHLVRGRWLTLIARALKAPVDIVREHLTEGQLDQFQTAAETQIASLLPA